MKEEKDDDEWTDLLETYVDTDMPPPATVRASPRLIKDLQALKILFSSKMPRLRRIRSKLRRDFYYGFGDASGRSFGTSIQLDEIIEFEYGQWCTEDSEQSSNWRELSNLCTWLYQLVREHKLTDCEVFVFTDNMTAERAFWKGTSSSEKLCDIVLALRELEMKSGITIHMVHVSDKE